MFAVVFQTCTCNPYLSLKLHHLGISKACQTTYPKPWSSTMRMILIRCFPSLGKTPETKFSGLMHLYLLKILQECPTTFRKSHSMALRDLTPPFLLSHLASLPSNCVLLAPWIPFSPQTDHLPTGPLFVLVQLLRISSATLYLKLFPCFS